MFGGCFDLIVLFTCLVVRVALLLEYFVVLEFTAVFCGFRFTRFG